GLGIGALAFELGDIGAAHEGLAAGAAYYHAADFGILGVILQDADEAVPHVERNSISLGGIIEHHVPDRAVATAVDLLFLHAPIPAHEGGDYSASPLCAAGLACLRDNLLTGKLFK